MLASRYKSIKETEAKHDEWIVISGIGGLGHVTVQYAKTMGLHVAVDVTDDKLALATRLGADLVANAATEGVVAKVVKGTNGGAHGVLVTAVSPSAFGQGIAMTRRRGTVSLLGLPPGEFPIRFSTLCSSASPCAAPSSARARISARQSSSQPMASRVFERRLDDIIDIFAEMKKDQIGGRIVLSQL